MNKKIIYIIVGALVILGLILGLWFWFFGSRSQGPETTNLFGSSGAKSGTGGTGTGNGGNNQAPIGGTAGTGVSGSSSGGTTDTGGVNNQTTIDQGSGVDTQVSDADIPYVGLADNSVTLSPDIVWNSNYSGGGSSGNVLFNPTTVNSVNTNNLSGNPYITRVIGVDGKPVDLTRAGYLVAIGGCIAKYEIDRLQVAPVVVLDNAINKVASIIGGPLAKLFGINIGPQPVYDTGTQTRVTTETISQCLARTLGRIAVQKITDSIVNWINSGFEGKPDFVQDYNKFFSDVGDQAAGEFLQSSNFAFLCSPFQLQVRIAIAQSYARRNNAPSCTLTQAVGNVRNFLNGDFSQGGWRGLISFTTEPANNPFGAYMTLQDRLNNAVTNAKATGSFDLTLGQGFLSVPKCDPVSKTPGAPLDLRPAAQRCKIVTPGRAIVSSFDASTQSTLDSLQIGDSIDQILGALQNALVSKMLYSGLSNVNKDSGTSNVDTAGQNAANALLNELRTAVSNAQQYGGVEQRMITDVQTAQSNLVDLSNCWIEATSSPTLPADKIATAKAGADAAIAKIIQLQTQVTLHNQNIQKANNSITKAQELQTDLILASLATEVAAIRTQWNSVKASDKPHVYTAADITSSQQDRTSVQSNMASINIDTSAKLQQCYALGQ